MKLLTALAFICAALLPSAALAVEGTMHGTIKNETAYFIAGEQRLDKMQNRLDLKPEFMLSDRWEFRSRVLGWYDAAMDIESGNNSDLTTSIQEHYRTFSEIKEAYILYGGDEFDLRLGQQQIIWGKTDGLRLLDIVNPLDMREFMLDDFLDSRMGVIAARLNYYSYIANGEHEFEFLIIPDAKVAEFAPAGSRWAYASPPVPAGITPVVLSGNEPGWSADNVEYGAAWRSNIDSWDLSLNWFYGWKDTPNLQKKLVGANLFITPVYSQMHTVGGSFSNAFGALVLRSELAVNIDESINTTSTITKTTTWNAALGLDYNKNNWRISPQIFVRHLQDWDTTVLEEQDSGFLSLMLSTDYLNDKLKPEIIVLFNWADDSAMVRPKVSYEFSDAMTVRLGGDLFMGQATTFFGQFDNNDRVYTEIAYSF